MKRKKDWLGEQGLGPETIATLATSPGCQLRSVVVWASGKPWQRMVAHLCLT